uniref:Uncharacterized protein n=1 Tax=Pipistrellus kuhlii TaxID=59472 RepID=A0A7J7Y919_PIPKU|nr:hypothetical protein mPipKuh1_010260 [Pipistrellus kuhlii]
MFLTLHLLPSSLYKINKIYIFLKRLLRNSNKCKCPLRSETSLHYSSFSYHLTLMLFWLPTSCGSVLSYQLCTPSHQVQRAKNEDRDTPLSIKSSIPVFYCSFITFDHWEAYCIWEWKFRLSILQQCQMSY